MAQNWDPERYARNARFVADFGEALLVLLAPKPGERILDLGCGDGALTEKLAATGASVVGVDAGAEMVRAAKARGLDARVMDGQALSFDHEFDAVFSNAAIHWMKRAGAVLAGVRRALKPGGRILAEFGGAGNVAIVLEALFRILARYGVEGPSLSPWYYATPEEYRRLLEANGFVVKNLELFPRPTPIPGELADWFETFGESFLSAVPASERETVKRQLARELAPKLRDRDGKWTLDYVRLRVAAHI